VLHQTILAHQGLLSASALTEYIDPIKCVPRYLYLIPVDVVTNDVLRTLNFGLATLLPRHFNPAALRHLKPSNCGLTELTYVTNISLNDLSVFRFCESLQSYVPKQCQIAI